MLDSNTDRIMNALGVILFVTLAFGGYFLFEDEVLDLVSGSDSFDVVYHLNEGSSEMNKRYLGLRGEHMVPQDEPAKDPFHFTGWLAIETNQVKDVDVDGFTKDDGEIYLPGETFKPKSDITMIAQWATRKYNIDFDVNEGIGEFPTEKVDQAPNGEKVSHTITSERPSRYGYGFRGWRNSDDNELVPVAGVVSLNNDIMLTAEWRLNNYDVEFDLNGGTGTFEKKTVDHGSDFIITMTEPKRKGYTFTGWKDQYNKDYAPGETLEIVEKMIFEAQWKINSYDISYNLNGGKGTFKTENVEYQAKHKIPEDKPTRTGYTFNGWVNSIDGKTYQPGQNVVVSEDLDIELKADWGINTYNVVYDLNKGSGSFKDAKVEFEKTHLIPTTLPTRKGYTFIGWRNDSDKKLYDSGSNVKITKDTTLSAEWEINEYLVEYDLKQGSGTFDSSRMNYMSEYKVLDRTPVRKGYTFGGWLNSVDGKVYQKNAIFKLLEDTVLSAQWMIDTYTVKFDLDGGSGTFDNLKYDYNTIVKIPTKTPTKTGHTFAGWVRSDVSQTHQAGESFNIQKDTTLKAKWNPIPYDVKYDTAGGSGSFTSSRHNFGTNHTVDDREPVRDGYIFKGWKRSDNGKTVKAKDQIKVSNHITLTAIWQAREYTIKYNANGGSGAPSNQTKVYGKTLKLSSTEPKRSGYRFDGWTTNSSGSGSKYNAGANYTSNGDQTLYAKWVKQERYLLRLENVNQSALTSNAYGFGGRYDFRLVKGQQYYFESSGSVDQTGINNGKYLRVYLYEPSWDYGSVSGVHKETKTTWSGGVYKASVSGIHRVRGYHYPKDGSRSGKSTFNTASIYQPITSKTHTWEYVDAGTVITLPQPQYSRDKYLFDGWVSGGKTYRPGDRVSINGETRFNARWVPESQSITYNKNGGSGGPGNTTAKMNSTFTVNHSSIPRKSGQVFSGWKNNRDGRVYSPGATFKVTGSTTLTAQFSSKSNVRNGVRIRVRKGARYYDQGTTMADFVPNNTYYVTDVSGNRIVFGRKADGSGTIGTVHMDDIILQPSGIQVSLASEPNDMVLMRDIIDDMLQY